MFSCAIDLVLQALHESEVIIRLLRVNTVWIVTRTSIENRGHAATRERPVRNAITVEITVTSEVFHGFENILFTDGLATVHWSVRIGESFTCPAVHSKIEVREAEDRCLITFRDVKGSPSKFKALLHSSGDDHDMLRITVASFIQHRKIRLLGTSGESG